MTAQPHHRMTVDPHRMALPTTNHRTAAGMAPPGPPHRMSAGPCQSVPLAVDVMSFATTHRMVPPTVDPHTTMVPPIGGPHRTTADPHMMARCVPELSNQGAELISADADTGGISCVPYGCLDTPPETYHYPTGPYANHWTQKDGYSRQESTVEEIAHNQDQLEFVALCDGDIDSRQPIRASLYGKLDYKWTSFIPDSQLQTDLQGNS